MLLPSGQTIPFAESDSHVKVNCVLAGEGFLEDCCSSRLTFSFPLCVIAGRAAASAIACEMMPWSDGESETANLLFKGTLDID